MKIEIGGGGHPCEGYVQVDAFGQGGTFGEGKIIADIRALPFRGLEEIYASHVLEHLPEVQVVAALKECRRALRPDGRLVVFVPDLIWFMRRFLNARSRTERWAIWGRMIFGSHEDPGMGHATGFSVRRLAECLQAAGFRKIETRNVKRDERHRIQEVYGEAYP